MLTEKEYLILCEVLSSNLISTIDKTNATLTSLAEALSSEYLSEVNTSPNLSGLKIKASTSINTLKIYIFEDNYDNTYVVFDEKEYIGNSVNNDCLDTMVQFVKDKMASEECILTGIKDGGIYAAYAANVLGLEAKIFGASTTEEMQGEIKNFIGENAPVGEFLDKVVFVKEKSIDEAANKPYSKTLVFDEKGKVVISEQTEYSKFLSWFYNNVGAINKDIWGIFFRDNEDILIDIGVYSVFMKIYELNNDGITKSLSDVVKYIEGEVNRKYVAFKEEYNEIANNSSIEWAELEDKLCIVTDQVAVDIVKIAKSAYESTEIILKGVGLFMAENDNIDTETLIEQFSENVDDILEKEIRRVSDFLDNSWQRNLDYLSSFPEVKTN